MQYISEDASEDASKQRAWDILFWPGIDKEIEKMVKSCCICNQNKKRQPKETLKPHPVLG
jgi:hypothetical protein